MENSIIVRADQAVVTKTTKDGTEFEIVNRSELAIFKDTKDSGCGGKFSPSADKLKCSGSCGVDGESCSLHIGQDSEGNTVKWCMCE